MGKHIVFYDGDCGLCNRSVQWALKYRLKSKPIYFAPLQSEEVKEFLKSKNYQINLDTIYYWNGYEVLERSDAVMRIAHRLKWPAQLAFYGLIFPKKIRDWGYNCIAKNRHRFFKGHVCQIPSEEEKALMLTDFKH